MRALTDDFPQLIKRLCSPPTPSIWRHAVIVACGMALSAGCNRKPQVETPPALSSPGRGKSVGVQLHKKASGWELTRNGTPYFILGAGGDGSKKMLAELGGNSVRTWGTDGLQQKLDEAHRHGLSVCVGIWLGHERHGFKWDDAEKVAQQKESVRQAILQYKDHPAVLLWALGNEMEGYGAGDNKLIWTAINDLALLVKNLDPNHPTMTVVAEIGGKRVQSINRWCPDIDIVGINSYGGAATVAERYRDAGGTKPWIITEFGPRGSWEVPKTSWGAALEPTSTEKAATYRRSYERAVLNNPEYCLGSYAFIWGHKQEATATWFGILLPDGSRLAAADVLSSLWTGKPPANACPILERISVDGPAENEPEAILLARLDVRDPDGDALQIKWVLQADPLTPGVGGDAEAAPPTFPDAIVEASERQVTIRLPKRAGAYRLYAYVADGNGGAAVANVPLLANRDAAER